MNFNKPTMFIELFNCSWCVLYKFCKLMAILKTISCRYCFVTSLGFQKHNILKISYLYCFPIDSQNNCLQISCSKNLGCSWCSLNNRSRKIFSPRIVASFKMYACTRKNHWITDGTYAKNRLASSQCLCLCLCNCLYGCLFQNVRMYHKEEPLDYWWNLRER